jgi:predicted TIM-barrel fold metal-dependent hydrolase
LNRLDNLYLEYHAFNLPDGLRRLAGEGLADRLLFGTGLPLRKG